MYDDINSPQGINYTQGTPYGGSGQIPGMSQLNNAYAHGGNVGRATMIKVPRGMIAVHANSREADNLDDAQGEKRIAEHHGNRRIYDYLDASLRNPHIRTQAIKMARHFYATGGHVRAKEHIPYHLGAVSADNGRYGDNEIIYIGPHLNSILTEAANGRVPRNPYDGHREFFGFGNVFGGLKDMFTGAANRVGDFAKSAWNAASPIVSPLVRSALPYAKSALTAAGTSAFGPMGGMVAGGLGDLAGDAIENNLPQGPQNRFQSAATDALRSGYNNYQNYTQNGGQINNAKSLVNALGGGTNLANTGANLAAQYATQSQQGQQPPQNPLLAMGYNLAQKYANQNMQQPQSIVQ